MDRPRCRLRLHVRRGAARRALVAFVLLLTVPLRALAGVAMPCCPIEAPTHVALPMPGMTHAGASPIAMTMHGGQDHAGHDGADDGGGGGHRSTASACCATVAIGASVVAPGMLPRGTHVLLARRIDPIAAFITDAPERPPRLHGLSA